MCVYCGCTVCVCSTAVKSIVGMYCMYVCFQLDVHVVRVHVVRSGFTAFMLGERRIPS